MRLHGIEVADRGVGVIFVGLQCITAARGDAASNSDDTESQTFPSSSRRPDRPSSHAPRWGELLRMVMTDGRLHTLPSLLRPY